jgi:hypothetical protein
METTMSIRKRGSAVTCGWFMALLLAGRMRSFEAAAGMQ